MKKRHFRRFFYFIIMKNIIQLMLFLTIVSALSCKSQEKGTMKQEHTNKLIHETSPYLLQHAHNPVDWNPWNELALNQAKKENKLIIISIGYAACHWCHVMEEESFEDEAVAALMNSSFINIKVDREERPDIDQVYMDAVQLMTGRGGWPLNIITLPDGRPIYGGTYFRKSDWINVLNQLQNKFEKQPEKLITYANHLEQGLAVSDLVTINTQQNTFSKDHLETMVNAWSKNFDHTHGGIKRSPKFMLPNNYLFLLNYAYLNKDQELQDYVFLTLEKMAYGGVFDQIGGGFSRYSVDIRWHVPHFEKMLYDNAQLVSLYAQAYKLTKNKLYKEIIIKTLHFISNDLMHKKGHFYSSLDADSLNNLGKKEEGAYYTWTKQELKNTLGDEYKIFADYYNVNEFGYWEHQKYVLTRKKSDHKIAKKHNLSTAQLLNIITACNATLLEKRSLRTPPNLDDKSLTSWNALMAQGYLDAYNALQDDSFLERALTTAKFIQQQYTKSGQLYHSYKEGKSTINGYLEDYAAVISLYLQLYENTLDQTWLNEAKNLTDYCYKYFYNTSNQLFYFTSSEDSPLIKRPSEIADNVIPSSNSIMAKNLFLLGHHFQNEKYLHSAEQMLNNIVPKIDNYVSSYSNWLDLYLYYTFKFNEVVIAGEKALTAMKDIKKHYLPNTLFAGSTLQKEQKTTSLPLLKNRIVKGKTYYYICENSVCKLPTEQLNQALTLISN